MQPRARFRLAGVAVAGLLTASCFNFHSVGTEPDPYSPPSLVSVTIEYHQPPECLAAADRCDGKVVFWGSWMVPGGEFSLAKDTGGHIWRGVAYAVPVNFPPRGDPYGVRVVDPYLYDSGSAGMTAERLAVGGEVLRWRTGEGTLDAHGLVYIDSNGQGRNPF
jgi:hypothetical protein